MSDMPTVISFYCGDQYYYDCADALRADCDRLGLPHDIEEVVVPEDVDWTQICRLKVGFYQRMVAKHGKVLWVDVDCRILRRPEMLSGFNFDLAGYAQKFRYIRDHNPYDIVRFWVPGVLFFNSTELSRAFVARMNEVERATTERITDDFCLHEAWTTFEKPLNVGFFAPTTVAKSMDQVTDDTVFLYGSSGNVAEYKGSVLQHNGLVDDRVKAKVLSSWATDVMKEGDRDTATIILRKAAEWDPSDPALVKRYADNLRATSRRDEAYEVLETYLREYEQSGEIRQAIVRMALQYRELDKAQPHLEALLSDPDDKLQAYARSAKFDYELEARAQAQKIPLSKRTPLWWMKTPYPGNFGDILNPYIVEHVSGRPPRFAGRPRGMLAIGSVIKFAQQGTTVWGTGTPRVTDELSDEADYRAVRGPLTRELVMRSGGSVPEIYGDPGLLLPRFYKPENVERKHAVGLIRHLNHRYLEIETEGVQEISIVRVGYDDIERFVDEILECEVILSTSLHGVITAHAYGVPARWCMFGAHADAIPGDGTKFEDYFRSVGLPSQTPLDLSDFPVIDESLARYVPRTVDLQFDADRLIESFPA